MKTELAAEVPTLKLYDLDATTDEMESSLNCPTCGKYRYKCSHCGCREEIWICKICGGVVCEHCRYEYYVHSDCFDKASLAIRRAVVMDIHKGFSLCPHCKGVGCDKCIKHLGIIDEDHDCDCEECLCRGSRPAWFPVHGEDEFQRACIKAAQRKLALTDNSNQRGEAARTGDDR